MATSPLCALYLALILAVGYVVISAIAPGRRHWAELLGLSYAAGWGTVAWALAAGSMTGRPPDRLVLSAIFGSTAVIGIGLWFKRRLATTKLPAAGGVGRWAIPGTVGFIVLIASIVNVAARTRWPGMNHIDVFAIWMFKAKVLALTPLRPLPAALTEPRLSYSHQDYPPAVAMMTAGYYGLLGRVDAEAAKGLLVPTYVALIGVLYGGMRRLIRPGMALALVAVAASGPEVIQSASLQMAEIPLMLMTAATVVSLDRWARSGFSADLRAIALFAGLAALVKNEGLAMLPVWAAVVVGLIVAGRSTRHRPTARIATSYGLAAAIAAAIVLPWLIYRTQLPHTHEDYGGRLTDPSLIAKNLGRLLPAARLFFGHAVDTAEAGLFWRLFGLTVLATASAFRRAAVVAVWAVLISQIGLFLASFVVTPWDIDVLVPMVRSRLLIQAVPVAAMLVAMHLHAAGVADAANTAAYRSHCRNRDSSRG